MKLLSVNEAKEAKERIFGEEVFLHGLLILNSQDVLIAHWPKSEQKQSSNQEIWVHTGNGPFKFDLPVLNRISGKRIVARGVLEPNSARFSEDPGLWWNTHFFATAITSFKTWLEEHGSET